MSRGVESLSLFLPVKLRRGREVNLRQAENVVFFVCRCAHCTLLHSSRHHVHTLSNPGRKTHTQPRPSSTMCGWGGGGGGEGGGN